MQGCEHKQGCLLFSERLADLPGLTQMFQQRYCDGAWDHCARYRLARDAGKHNVPLGLMPNNQEWADELAAEALTRA